MIDEFEFKLDTSEARYTNFFRAEFKHCLKTYELRDFEMPEVGEYMIHAITNGSIGFNANTLPITTLYVCFEKHQRGMQWNTWTISIVYDDYIKRSIYKVCNIKLQYRRKPKERNETIVIDIDDQEDELRL